VSLDSLTKHLRVRMRKEKRPSQATRATKNTNTPSLKSLIELRQFWRLREDSIYLMCLGVESFALVLNEMFGMLGWIWMRWLRGCWDHASSLKVMQEETASTKAAYTW
jgi:hypothetical protein